MSGTADVIDWPGDGVEPVPRCPVCRGSSRELLYSGLTDTVFSTAPGRWTLHRCLACGSAFLDPRPTRETIRHAYADYYTHAEFLPAPTSGLKAAILNGYLNSRWGYKLRPASRLGAVARLLPKRRAYADGLVRHLPSPDAGARLLDVGCGDGSFVGWMRSAGWEAEGLEPDPVAAQRARSRGIPVATSPIEEAPFEPGSFDAVTMNHVIEHLHDPTAALAVCGRLLRPGGTLWLATPNLASHGHAMFGRDWIGLDPPRHLVVFTRRSLVSAVKEAGFAIRALPRVYSAERVFPCSAAVAAGEDPRDQAAVARRRSLIRTRAADLVAVASPGRAEDVVVIARRAA